ncbi:hypothetical protein, partial [Pseudogemmobacter sonorensis]|uniref:hypothetical protein n=1 Tax=Pseudogemmobacter sonorensis TaxID=2989681 RepID=UPI0036AC10B8
ARLVLFQNADDLIFGESAARHLWSSRLGQCLTQTGLATAGNVTVNYMCPERWTALIVDLDQIRVSPYRPVAHEATTEGLTHEGNRSHVLKSEIPCIH